MLACNQKLLTRNNDKTIFLYPKRRDKLRHKSPNKIVKALPPTRSSGRRMPNVIILSWHLQSRRHPSSPQPLRSLHGPRNCGKHQPLSTTPSLPARSGRRTTRSPSCLHRLVSAPAKIMLQLNFIQLTYNSSQVTHLNATHKHKMQGLGVLACRRVRRLPLPLCWAPPHHAHILQVLERPCPPWTSCPN